MEVEVWVIFYSSMKVNYGALIRQVNVSWKNDPTLPDYNRGPLWSADYIFLTVYLDKNHHQKNFWLQSQVKSTYWAEWFIHLRVSLGICIAFSHLHSKAVSFS